MRWNETWKGLLLAPALLLAACGTASSGSTAAPGLPSAATGATATAAAPVGDAALLALLEADLQDEYRAEALYQRVLADLGDVRPFANIVWAEGQHARSVVGLYAARGWSAPASRFSPESMPSFASLREACQAGWAAEVANIALYDSQLGQDLPADVRRVLQANRAASLDNHLPAFDRCR